MQQVASRAQQADVGHFEFRTTLTHVHVRATSKSIGMPELAAVMRKDPNLHNCVVETCGFDGQAFTAVLRIDA
jgi:hypothetical protein